MMAQRPNLLVIMTDQQKANAIQMYGNPDVPTPSLERLAARGIRYDQCYTPHPLCVPARVSFWTGRYSHEHGSRTNEILMPTGERHFARILHDAGYRLALLGKNHCFQADDLNVFDEQYIFAHQGPDDPEDEKVAEVVRWIRSPRRPANPEFRSGEARLNPFKPEHCPTAVLARRVSRFLEQQDSDHPFCAWVSVPDPHGPLQCPEPYASLHPPAGITLPPWSNDDLDQKMERVRVFRQLLGYDHLNDEDIRFRVSIYYGMIRFLDDAVGQILDTLDRCGLTENTVVVFTSDHGDYAGEHRLTDKSGTFYDCMTRVPLLVSWPGHLPVGVVDRNLVSLLDVMPTCLGLANVSRPIGIDGRMLPGTGDDPPRDAVFSEYGAGGPRLRLADLPRFADQDWSGDQPQIPLLRWREAEGHPKMVRMGPYKYVYDPLDDVDELYDLVTDPWELTNLASNPTYTAVRSTLRDRLLDWSIRTEGGRPTPLYFEQSTGHNTPEPFWIDRTAH
ncbi:MAG TPA: sulfatase-like hydrolase/transferase [Chloroflexota bacterium]|nr:sulfatase-like hydrolase/transferase [Chloroflexota bacterium]